MKGLWAIVGVLFMGGLAAGIWGKPPKPAISAKDALRDYRDYEGKPVRLGGKVLAVHAARKGHEASAVLDTGTDDRSAILTGIASDVSGKIAVGDSVALTCTGAGARAALPVFTNCSDLSRY